MVRPGDGARPLFRARRRVQALAPPTALDDFTTWCELAVDQATVSLAAGRPYAVVKRLLDVVVSASLLVVLLLPMLLIALVVKLSSPGAILFRQRRVGRHGRSFEMLKFRTMIQDRRRRTDGPIPGDGDRRRVHKSRRDPRVTRVGRYLRRTSLDELPQLWNVFKGEMSLVGPRPELPQIVGRYELWQHARHYVTPGVTGWWQVNRDDALLMHEATELDLYYVEHLSLKLDLLILLRTIAVVPRGHGSF